MASKWPSRLGLLAIAATLGAGLYLAFRETPLSVDVALVSEGPMRVTIREQGVTRVKDVFAVSAPIAGHLSRTGLIEGQKVESGKTVIASIHPLDPPLLDTRTVSELEAFRDAAKSAVGIAAIDLQRADSALKLAEDDLRRATKLYSPGIISESALQRFSVAVDNARAASDAARATIGVRQAELASAEARLVQTGNSDAGRANCCIDILAPVSGTVLTIDARSEQAVSAGMRIASIGDISDLEAVVELLSADAVRIHAGTQARISGWGGPDLAAVVRRIDPSGFTKVSALGIEEQRVNVVLDLTDKEPRLGHNFRIFADMTVWECASCVQVPVSALFREGNNWAVFAIANDRAALTPVDIGHMNGETAEVIGGLAAATPVIMHPNDILEDGALVSQRDGESTGKAR